MASRKSREQLIGITQALIDAELPEEELNSLIEDLEMSVPHPEVTDLIYYHDPKLSAAEIVDRALAYRPVEL